MKTKIIRKRETAEGKGAKTMYIAYCGLIQIDKKTNTWTNIANWLLYQWQFRQDFNLTKVQQQAAQAINCNDNQKLQTLVSKYNYR